MANLAELGFANDGRVVVKFWRSIRSRRRGGNARRFAALHQARSIKRARKTSDFAGSLRLLPFRDAECGGLVVRFIGGRSCGLGWLLRHIFSLLISFFARVAQWQK